MTTDHGLDGYLTHRVLTRDLAEQTGEYDDWPEISVELSDRHSTVLRAMADHHAVDEEDFIVAVLHWHCDRVLGRS